MEDVLGRLCEKVLEKESTGRRVIRLHTVEPSIADESIFTAARKALTPENSRYSPSGGIPELRAKLAQKYGLRPENAAVSAGSRMLIYTLTELLLKKGENVVIPDPEWAHFLPPILAKKGINVRRVRRRLELNWRMHVSELAGEIDEKTRAVILSNPNNPTGACMNGAELEAISRVCERKRAYLILDVAYEGLANGKAMTAQPASGNTIIVGTFSKSFGMTGFRVGYAICSAPRIIREIIDFNYATIQCTPRVNQLAALFALEHERHLIEGQRKIYAKKLALASGILEKNSIPFVKPQCACFLFVDLGTSAESFCGRLLERKGVAICPGSAFGSTCNHYARVSLTAPEKQIAEGLTALAAELRNERASKWKG